MNKYEEQFYCNSCSNEGLENFTYVATYANGESWICNECGEEHMFDEEDYQDELNAFTLEDPIAEAFSYENLMRQFLYSYCPDLDGDEFDDAMEELRALGRIAVKEAEKDD